jgi:hypothetical protein
MDSKVKLDANAKLREGTVVSPSTEDALLLLLNSVCCCITFLFYLETKNENTREIISMGMYNALWTKLGPEPLEILPCVAEMLLATSDSMVREIRSPNNKKHQFAVARDLRRKKSNSRCLTFDNHEKEFASPNPSPVPSAKPSPRFEHAFKRRAITIDTMMFIDSDDISMVFKSEIA